MKSIGLTAFVSLVLGALSYAAPVTVSPANAVIVLTAKTNDAINTAARELQKHLKLVTDTEFPVLPAGSAMTGKFPFFVGVPAPGDTHAFAPEEARWAVTPEGVYLYGADKPDGTLFAVYAFLEEALGLRWIEPGDKGIAYDKQAALTLAAGATNWIPGLELRKIRTSFRVGQYPVMKAYVAEYADFLVAHEPHDQRARDTLEWQKRMRMGGHASLNYGHAFTGWWEKYGKTHPEYFAVNKYGKRQPERRVESGGTNPVFNAEESASIKLCASSTALVERIVQDWVAGGKRNPQINVCENDQVWGFCRCPDCLKLDGRKPGEPLGDYLTGLSDRYVYLANQVARAARKIDPHAGVIMYAYEAFELPPLTQKVDSNVVVAIVPTRIDKPYLEKLFGGWHAAGATKMITRPNYPCYYETTAFPMGFEKTMADALQIALTYNVVAADYDSLIGMWPVYGLADYVQARVMSDPAKPFEYWEDHFCAAYGAAAPEVKAYFRYWRTEVWDKRMLPDMDRILEKGKFHNFSRGLVYLLADYYKPGDFESTDAILAAAAKKTLSEAQKDKVNQLVLANRNARLTYEAIVTKGAVKFEKSTALLQFRKQNKDALRMNWLGLFAVESRFGDVTGTKIGERLKDFPPPWTALPLAWNFKLDPQDAGLQENWQALPRAETKKWEFLRTDSAWENPYDGESYPSKELRARLTNYNGIGWYVTGQAIPKEMKDRDIFLYFGAVDESAWVYVNGKPAGEHVFAKSDDWTTPFEIQIDSLIDWDKPEQEIAVRVEDKDGSGGIWKPVWVVSKIKAPGPR
jgi:hypothetical protein